MLDYRLPFSSLYEGFQAAAARWPDKVVVKDDGRDTPYHELENLSRRAGRGLISLGLNAGDRIGIWAVNHTDWIVAGLGNQAAGGVLVPLNTRLRAREVADIIRRANVRVLFCDQGFGDYDFIGAISKEGTPSLRKIVVFGDGPSEGPAIGWGAFLAKADDTPESGLDERIAQTQPDSLADIIFTSGTTGRPKGVPMTHKQSLIACEQQQLCVSEFIDGDVFGEPYPFTHNAGYRAGWQISVLLGVTIIPIRNPDPLKMLELIDREKITYLPSVPLIYQAMLDHPKRAEFDLSSIRSALTGATIVPVKLVERMQETFGVNAVRTGYGLTETAGSVTSTRPGDSARIIAETTGRPLDNLDVKLIDADGCEVATGEAGEIVVRGPQVMTAYFEDPEATAAAFTEDGFLRTGDVGVFDAGENLKITDRIKDMYIVGGFNTYPAEIEQQLSRLEGVAEVAVVGIDDERLGQVGRAFIVCRPGATLDESSVIAWCRDNMANYKAPRVVTFVDSLPRNHTGKIAKTELRAVK